ncbi:MAG: DNA polymerase III subunit gamma/tau [Muribaculaceae bacterium]|nr:DNA polymerase III subunit gamma/tau [Muribaculaceae bacterium]
MSENTPYIVSARKYRPATFASVVGQKALTTTLKNAIDSRRLAQAYLFTGPRGVGKTSCARIFAKTINCLSPTADGEACGVCEACVAMEQGNSFNIIELDAASNNSVDDIRSITDQVNVPPRLGHYRVFIIDEVHMLSSAAFNAFLKTLEEPPSYVIFILATTEKHKVLPTILSRCQIYDFKRITIDDMASHLSYVASQEGIETTPDALNVIARKADGAMRDALSIFDQVAASTMGHITYEATIANLNVLDYEYYFRLIDAFRTGDVAASLLLYKEIRDKGFDSLFFINGLAAHVRDLMVAADRRTLPLLEVAHEVGERYAQQALTLPLQWYYAALRLLNDCDINYRTASDKRLLVELTLIRLCQLLTPATPPFDAIDNEVPLRAIHQPQNSQKPTPQPQESAVTSQPNTVVTPPPVTSPSAVTSAQPTTSSAQSTVSPSQTSSQIHQTSTDRPSTPQYPQSPVSSPTAGGNPIPPAMQTRPAGSPAMRPISPQPTRTVPKGPPRTIRISDTSHIAPVASLEQRSESFTPEAFNLAWQQFIIAHPTLHILTNAMRTATPQAITATNWRIMVSHPAQQQAFESAMTTLMPFLRDRLRNDLLTLTIEVSEAPAVERQMPPGEFLKKIISSNGAIAQFLTNIDAELA